MQSIKKLDFGKLESLWAPWAQSPSPQMAATGAPVAAAVKENYGWILHPWIDSIFVCGGLVWIFALLATNLVPGINHLDAKMLYSAFFFVFVVPHGMATILRVYDVPTTRKANGMKVALLAGGCLLLLIIGCLSAFWASMVARMALCFSFQHGLGQAYGIALIYCYKRKFYLTKWEKRIFSLVIQAGILHGVTTVLAQPHIRFAKMDLVPLFGFPSWINQICDITLVSAVLAFFIVLGRKFFVEKRLMPLPAILTIATGFLIYAILMPFAITLNAEGVSIPKAAQQAVGWLLVLYYLAHGLFHTPQYLVVTTAVQLKNRAWPESLPFSKIASQLFSPRAIKYYLTVYSIAWLYMCLSVPMGSLFNHIGLNQHPELWFLVFISCTNLHHYWTDSIIWRMKDKENLRLLIS